MPGLSGLNLRGAGQENGVEVTLFRRVASGIDVDCRSVARLYKVKKSVNCREYVRSDGTERDKDDEAARGSNTFFTFSSRNQAGRGVVHCLGN